MTETNPSVILVAAADRLRDLAAHFDAYAKAAEFTLPNGKRRFESPVEAWLYDAVERNAPLDAGAWIAALSPVVAGPLEDWLRAEAGEIANGDEDRISPEWAPLRFARQVLGAGEEQL